MKRLGSVLSVLLLVAACGGNDDDGAAAVGDDSDLRPADEIGADEEQAATLDGEIGVEVDLGLGLGVTVSAMRVGGDDGGPWLEVDIRAENRGEEATNPGVAIVCNQGTEEGGWQADSTFDLLDDLPTDSFNEGTIHLLLPEDGRYGEPIPECLAPAFIRVTPNSGFVVYDGEEPDQRAVDFEIPAATVAELNAARSTG